MRTLLAVTVLLLTSSCLKLKGQFQSSEQMIFLSSTFFGGKKKVKLPAGTYKSTFTFQSKTKVALSFKKVGRNQKSYEVSLKIPSNVKLPQRNGKISLPASKTKQLYDIKGTIATQYEESRTYNDTETCTYTTTEYRCQRVCDGRGRPGRPNCRRECGYYPVDRVGSREVTYHYLTTTKDLKLKFLKPSSQKKVANYNGDYEDTSKIYEYEGACY